MAQRKGGENGAKEETETERMKGKKKARNK
jgi:hypothetical protein